MTNNAHGLVHRRHPIHMHNPVAQYEAWIKLADLSIFNGTSPGVLLLESTSTQPDTLIMAEIVAYFFAFVSL